MQVDDDTWARLREAYEAGGATPKAVAERFGVSVQRLAAKARAEGWTRPALPREKRKGRPNATRRAGAAKKPAAPGKAARTQNRGAGLPTQRAQRALIGRLYRAISLKLEHMEKRMASGDARSAQDEERESRALATLINNFEKVTEAVAELDKERDAPRSARGADTDAERMRREIAERLERLGGIGPDRKGSGGARS